MNRREMLRRAWCGMGGGALAGLLAACSGGQKSGPRPLTPAFYDWILNFHRDIETGINPEFARHTPVEAKVAPVQGFGIERFVTEAKEKTSTWDVYVGMTPFVEMAALVEAGVIEPWDPYIPKDVLDDLVPSVREEGTYRGKLYSWPFFMDIIVQGWNGAVVEKAGLDPAAAPKTWDEFLAHAKKVKDSGAASFGCTFDAHGWRSLAPITHSISTNAYTPEGLFDFACDAAVEALEILRRMKELANPDVLNPGTSDAGVNDTPDEGAFAGGHAAYYIKYQNAHLRYAGKWTDPSRLRLAGLPKTEKGAGATVFWDTGAALMKHGGNKEQAGKYLKALTYDERVWKRSIGGGREAVGQLPVYQSLWNKWKAQRPGWMQDWALLVFEQLKASKAIQTHKFGLTQFNIGQPHWEKYLKGEEKDAKKALQAAKDAVWAKVKG